MRREEQIGFMTIGATAVAVGVGFLASWEAGVIAFGALIFVMPSCIKFR